MLAAIAAAEHGHQVQLFEKNEKLGKKIYITGKGRCNVTNACDTEELFAAVVHNPKFLYSSFYSFTNQDMMELVERNGCPLKTERGGRVFPVSDKSSDVIRALTVCLKNAGVQVRLYEEVDSVETRDGRAERGGRVFPVSDKSSDVIRALTVCLKNAGVQVRLYEEVDSVETRDGRVSGIRLKKTREIVSADAVIVATGGLSYPSTGSTGDGYRFAEKTGHTVTDLSPALVPFETAEPVGRDLQGLALKNIQAKILKGKKVLYEEFGEMLFTHFGVSGPVLLSARVGRDLQGLALKNIQAKILKGKKVLYEEFGEMLFTHFGVSGPVLLSASSYGAAQLKKGPLTLSLDLKPALSEEQLDARILRDFEEQKNKQYKNSLSRLLPAKMIPVIVERSGIDPDKKINSQGF